MSRLKGVSGARRRARRRPTVLDQKVVSAISDTVDDVHREGRLNIDAMVQRKTGLLRRKYRKYVRKQTKTGQVGYLTPSARRSAFYARFVHDGTKAAGARPFHDLAVLQHEAAHRRRMRRALRATVRGRR